MSKIHELEQRIKDRKEKEDVVNHGYLAESTYYPSATEDFCQIAFMEHKEVTKLLITHIINLENRMKSSDNSNYDIYTRLRELESRVGLIEEVLIEIKSPTTRSELDKMINEHAKNYADRLYEFIEPRTRLIVKEELGTLKEEEG